jgi:hypothetical protein
MSSKQAPGLASARLNDGPKVPALTSAHAGANCIGKAMPGASFTSEWYRPERLMSQSERLPS